jgi:hypothetical protein
VGDLGSRVKDLEYLSARLVVSLIDSLKMDVSQPAATL